MQKYRVGIVGYGTIGKRVADALMQQHDMELVGITAHSYNYRILNAHRKGIKIYALSDEVHFFDNGIKPAGKFDDLIRSVDVIVDCSPKKIAAEHKPLYEKAGKKAIFQGGEKHALTGCSFVAQCNYAEALNKQFVRVVSCNTTGLARTLDAIDKGVGIEIAHATMIRRGADPWDSDSGPINAIVPVLELPSHHGPDVRTVLHNMEIFTTAMSIPTTLMHMHSVTVDLKRESSAKEILGIFEKTTRIRLVRNALQVLSTAEVMEMARDEGYPRGDLPSICVWEEGVGTYKKKLFYLQAVHQESDVICENIDAIRAVMGFPDGRKSIEMTNKALNIR